MNAMSPNELDALVERAIDAASQAGRILVDDRPNDSDLEIDSKSTITDIVTEMDKRSEALLVDLLLAGRADDGVLGEEGAQRDGTSGVRWVIDPIDGTVNYLYRQTHWSVCIGIEVEGQAVGGVVLCPALGEMYVARTGSGAFVHTSSGKQQLQIGSVAELDMALVATGFGYAVQRRANQAKVVAQLAPKVRDFRRLGAASVDMCWLASGRLDAYYEKGLNPWDYLAASVVVREAGGIVEGINGAPPNADLTIATNPGLFPAFHDTLVSLGAQHC